MVVKNPATIPSASVVIPTLNEELTIFGKLQDIDESAGEARIDAIFVVDSSPDYVTLREVDRYVNRRSSALPPIVKVKDSVRNGKGTALRSMISLVTSDVVIVTDADSRCPPKTVRLLLDAFRNPRVGLACAELNIESFGHPLTEEFTQWYRDFYSKLRMAESLAGVAFITNGQAYAFRREFAPYMPEAAEDSGLALRVMLEGWLTIHVPGAKVVERIPRVSSDRRAQRLRRATNIVDVLASAFSATLDSKTSYAARASIIGNGVLYVYTPLMITLALVLSGVLVVFYPLLLVAALFAAAVFLLDRRRQIPGFIYFCLLGTAAILQWLGGERFVRWEVAKRDPEVRGEIP